jgi:hypothetical protein
MIAEYVHLDFAVTVGGGAVTNVIRGKLGIPAQLGGEGFDRFNENSFVHVTEFSHCQREGAAMSANVHDRNRFVRE